jgi:hypothetical protein
MCIIVAIIAVVVWAPVWRLVRSAWSAQESLLRHIEITIMTTEATATTGRTDMSKTPAIMVPDIIVPDIARVIVTEVGRFLISQAFDALNH